MKSIVRIICWERSHVNELSMNKAQEKKLEADIPKLKKVCPDCKPNNCHIVIVNGTTIFNPAKAYKCEHGHLSLISPLSTTLHVSFGPHNESFFNIEAHIDDLPDLLDSKDISCHHVVDGKQCDSKLDAIDDFKLSYPSATAIRTKTRIGDLWDRHGIEPVRTGSYDGDNNFKESRTQKANKARLTRLRQERNIPVNRTPGQIVDKATQNDYGHRDKSSVNPERLE